MYEQFRSQFYSRLVDKLPIETLHTVLKELDYVADNYEITSKCTDITTIDATPEILKVYIASLLVENKAKSTLSDYTRILKRFFANVNKPFSLVTTNDIRLYLIKHQTDGHLKKSSIEHIRVVINAFYSWLVDQEYMTRNPARKIEPIRVKKEGRDPIPRVELEMLRAACVSLREKALIDFLYSTGCRVSECAALKINDIDWREHSVKIRHGKGDKSRITYFNAESEVSLKRYLASRKFDSDALFSRSRFPYGNVSRNALETEVRHVRSRVSGLSVDVVPHAFRDTFATTLAENGMPIEQIQILLGHENISTTMRYVRVSQEEAKSAHKKCIS